MSQLARGSADPKVFGWFLRKLEDSEDLTQCRKEHAKRPLRLNPYRAGRGTKKELEGLSRPLCRWHHDDCFQDGLRATQLKSDFAKGWVLVAKAETPRCLECVRYSRIASRVWEAMWKEGSRAAALKQIEAPLHALALSPNGARIHIVGEKVALRLVSQPDDLLMLRARCPLRT